MKDNIDDVIATILNGTATGSDRDFFNKWLEEDDLNQEIFEHIKNYWQIDDKKLEIINEDDIRNKIWAKAHKPRHTKPRSFLPYVYRVAAVLVFALFFTFLIKEFSSPSTEKIRTTVLKTIEKKNLAGAKSKIHLPDGSTVNLNAESSIKFVEGFRDSVRWVELNGEAYFDVAKNSEKPFIVKSGDIVTKALGTIFNINAYHDKPTVHVSLVEGKVEVRSIHEDQPGKKTYLEPGQFASFENNELIENGAFDKTKVLGWKDGVIIFENANYAIVVKRLERWFGVRFKNEGSEPQWNFDARFENVSLEGILEVLSHSEQFEYQLFENTVKLKTK